MSNQNLEIKKCNHYFMTVKADDEWEAQRLIDEFMQDQDVMDYISYGMKDRGYDFEDGEKTYCDAESDLIDEILGKGNKLEKLRNLINTCSTDYSARFVEE